MFFSFSAWALHNKRYRGHGGTYLGVLEVSPPTLYRFVSFRNFHKFGFKSCLFFWFSLRSVGLTCRIMAWSSTIRCIRRVRSIADVVASTVWTLSGAAVSYLSKRCLINWYLNSWLLFVTNNQFSDGAESKKSKKRAWESSVLVFEDVWWSSLFCECIDKKTLLLSIRQSK